MNDKPKDKDAADSTSDEDAPETIEAPSDAGPTEAEKENAIEAEWSEGAEEAEKPSEAEATSSDDEAETATEDTSPNSGDMAAAAALAGAATVGAGASAAAEAPEETQEPQKRGGAGALAYIWLVLLTLGVGYVLYILFAEPGQLRDRLALSDVPEIKAGADAGAAAAENSQKIAALTESQEQTSAALAETRTAVEQTQAKVEAATAGGPGSNDLEDKIGVLEAALADAQAKLATVSTAANDTAAAEAASAAAQAAQAAAGDNAAAVQSLGERLDGLKADLDGLGERLAALEARAERASGRSLAKAILAINDLRDGVASGKPFETLLDRALAASPEAKEIASETWTAYADRGLPDEGALLADMQALSVAIGQDKLKQDLNTGESWLDRAVGGVVNRLKVRRVGADVAGQGPAGVAARAEAALADGDLATAIEEVERLEGDDAARFADWLGRAQAIRNARTDIDAIEKAAIAAADGA